MLVGAAANDKVENLPLARRQCRDMGANHVELALQATRHFMMRNRSRNCPKKIVRRYGLGQKIIRTRLDGPYRGRNIKVTTEEYDRQRRTEFAQPRLEFRTAYPRHPDVKDNTAWDTFARQAIQQVLGRSVGGNLVTGYRQTTFHRCPDGRIVINNMHAPLHRILLDGWTLTPFQRKLSGRNGSVGATLCQTANGGCQGLECPSRVNRVVLTARRSLPVYPDERTSSDRPRSMSGWCQQETFRLAGSALCALEL